MITHALPNIHILYFTMQLGYVRMYVCTYHFRVVQGCGNYVRISSWGSIWMGNIENFHLQYNCHLVIGNITVNWL